MVAITTTVVLGPKLFPAAEPPEPPLEVTLVVGHPDLAVVPEPRPSASPDATVVLSAMEVTTTTSAVAVTTTTTVVDTPTTTETTVAPTTSTTDAPRKATNSTSAPAEKKIDPAPTTTTSTTAAPRPIEVTPPPAPPVAQTDGTQTGDVSWYELEGARSGVCAHRYLDKGTVVTVTNLATKASITCTVDDRGPYSGDDKILDLFRDDFARLAPLEEGVVAARLDW